MLLHFCSLGLPSGLLPSRFPTKTLYAPLISPIPDTCPVLLNILDLSFEQYLLSTGNAARHYAVSSISRYLFPLWPKHLPQHPILTHPNTAFLPPCQRPSFTPIKKNKQNRRGHINHVSKISEEIIYLYYTLIYFKKICSTNFKRRYNLGVGICGTILTSIPMIYLTSLLLSKPTWCPWLQSKDLESIWKKSSVT
jgi:hypothetical protein